MTTPERYGGCDYWEPWEPDESSNAEPDNDAAIDAANGESQEQEVS